MSDDLAPMDRLTAEHLVKLLDDATKDPRIVPATQWEIRSVIADVCTDILGMTPAQAFRLLTPPLIRSYEAER